MASRLVLVSIPEGIHIGAHFKKAAGQLGLETEFCDTRQAFGEGLPAKVFWRLSGRRPLRLRPFSREVVEVCRRFKPDRLLCLGLAPVEEAALREIGRMGIRRISYLTDDPWNPAHRSGWMLRTIREYDEIFSPRRANLSDLRAAGAGRVVYLPFAYEPSIHFPQTPSTEEERARYACDLLFFGGADPDRLRWVTGLIRQGFRPALYGGYWDRCPETRPYHRGSAEPAVLRWAVSGAKVVLCLVRQANRDGNSMRSFEIPAMRGCMLAQETEEHRELFGPEGETVLYFRTPEELSGKSRWLLERPEERARLAQSVFERITRGGHTYKDRLRAILGG